MLSYVTRTTCQPKDGMLKYERFTTQGVNRKALKVVSFAARYLLNVLEHHDIGTPVSVVKRELHQFRKSDLVRALGIRYNLDMNIGPKSGWKIRVFLIQTNRNWDGIVNRHRNAAGVRISAGDGAPWEGNNKVKQGGFDLQGSWFTRLCETDDGEVGVQLHSRYDALFDYQKKTYEHLEYQNMIAKLRVTHPECHCIYQDRFTVVNKTKKPIRRMVNKMIKTFTTWKYLPRLHDNALAMENNIPDRKVYFMFIAMPMFGGEEDTGQDMFGLDEFTEKVKHVGERRQHHVEREGSVVSDRFGSVPVKQEEIEEVEEEADDAMKDSTARFGNMRVTRSMTANPDSGVPDEHPYDVIDPSLESPHVRELLRAFELNRKIAKADANLEANVKKKPPKRKKEPKPPDIETNAFGWAYDSTIMIRPTFELFWYNLNKYRGLRP
jgi:hypothetical protein